MELANTYFMNKWPDPTQAIVTDKTRPSNLWTRGTYYEGLMAYYYICRDTDLYTYAVDWGTFHKWEPTYGGTTATDADFICCTQTYIELYQLDPKPERISKITSNADYLINSTRSNYWWWIDALQMAMPVFAKLGTVYSDNKYFDALYRFYSFTRYRSKGTGLYNTTDHLWYRDSTFLPPITSPNGKQVYWSRGNGWVFAGLARVLDVMPETAPHYAEYLTTFLEMAEALIAVQRYDGFWNMNLADSLHYGGKETSGTAFFTFGLAWGINKGILSDAIYRPYVVKAWNGMVNDALHPDGAIGYMQTTGKEPVPGVAYDILPAFEDYGLGAFLLAGSQVYKLAADSVATGNQNIEQIKNAELLPAYPNPFNNVMHISYRVGNNDHVNLAIFDILGNKIYTIHNNRKLRQGTYHETWNGTDQNGKQLPNGVYIIRFQASKYMKVQKVNLLR